MRILYIITQGEQGGGQKNVLDLALGMKERGHDVFVAVGKIENEGDKWLHQELASGGIKKENLLEIKNLQREVNPLLDLKAWKEVVEVYKKIAPEVVHLHSSKAGVVGGLASLVFNLVSLFKTPSNSPLVRGRIAQKVRTVYTVHGFVFLEPLSKIKKLIFILLEFISSLCRDFTILISPVDVAAGKKFLVLRGSSFKIIYNGLTEKIKESMLGREEARKYLIEKIPPTPYGKMSAPIVGTISNLYKTKGLEYLIDAAKKVVEEKSNTIFVVLGFGDENYQNELLYRVKKKGLENNFFFLGKTPQAYKYLKGLDLFTLTSVKEGLPYTLIEARMAGVPILASAVGGIPEMAKNFEIDLVEAKNVEQIAGKVLGYLTLPLLAKERSSANDSLPDIYTLENMLIETEKVYKNLVK